MFSQKHGKGPSGKAGTMVSFQAVCSYSELQCGLCTSLAHGIESLGVSERWQ